MDLNDLQYSIWTFNYKHQDLRHYSLYNYTSMENQQQIIAEPSLSYFSGWLVALSNYNVFEIESINQLVSISNDKMPPELDNINEQNLYYFTINFSE